MATLLFPNRPKPTFLTLHGEIRNHIYRLVLLSEDNITISKGPSVKPALFSTCRQIYKESAATFYLENKWIIDLPDWDSSVFEAFYDQVRVQCGITEELSIRWDNSGSCWKRSKMLKFLQHLHKDPQVISTTYETQHGVGIATISGAFAIVARLHKHSWHDIEQVLEIYLNEVVRDKQGWKCECE
jgi:hypothetical protein